MSVTTTVTSWHNECSTQTVWITSDCSSTCPLYVYYAQHSHSEVSFVTYLVCLVWCIGQSVGLERWVKPLSTPVMYTLVVVKLLEVYLERDTGDVCLQRVARGLLEKISRSLTLVPLILTTTNWFSFLKQKSIQHPLPPPILTMSKLKTLFIWLP